MALPLQGSATYNAPPVFNDPDFHDLQPHEQAQVLGSLYPTFNTLSPQDQAGILTGIQNTYNPDNPQNSLTGFFNALNTANNQTPQYTNQPNLTTQSIPPSFSNPQSPVGGLQPVPIQTPANHPLVSLLNQTVPQNGNNLDQTRKRGTLLANAEQTIPGGPFAHLPGMQNNALQQPGNTSNLKAQIQMLGQKYDQLNQMASNPALDAQTRQNAKAAGLQLQNIYRQLNQQNARTINRNLPQLQQPSTMQTTQQASPWQQLKAGNVLHDDDMRQLFQSIQAKGNSAAEQRQANLLHLYAVQKLAENTLAHARKSPNGNVMIQGVPVRAQDALYFAKQDIQHFLDAQTHLNPNQLLATKATATKSTVSPHRVNLLYVDASGISANPIKYYGRVFGHTALEIDGMVYNYTPKQFAIIPANKFIENVTNKSTRKDPAQNIYAYPLDLSSQEISILKRELSKNPGKYDLQKNSCATYTIRCLEKATRNSKQPIKINYQASGENMLSGNALSPSDVIDSIKKADRIIQKPQIYTIHTKNPKEHFAAYPWNWGLK